MSPAQSRATVGNGTGTILARRRVSYSPADLAQAVRNLEAAGCRVTTEPFLLEHAVMLAAWHAERQEGFLIESAELGLVARQGVGILDPHAAPGSAARWQRLGEPERLRRYAEATLARICDEVASAPDGARNVTLNKAAYSLGGLLGWDVLDEHEMLDALLRAAACAGLPDAEARLTATRALERGAENPRPKPEPRPYRPANGLDAWRPTRGA